ncbi:hypothetical protein PIB30_013259 [Stylosanthes scabra]|uniref:Uncharacterized protein n=1 Tax=Stylosanthes scabra TaxID=79078 RepID=A0ABU6R5C4_9FABA|nr:hypothetical protein [Stylosanthes scabra]
MGADNKIYLNSEKVVFAEASKDVVDILFTLLQLPLGTVVKLLTKKAVGGSLGMLYSSVEKLDCSYMQPNTSKNLLLDPYVPTSSSTLISALLSSINSNDNAYAYAQSEVTPKLTKWRTKCPDRWDAYEYDSRVNKATPPPASSDGFVKEVVNYMVMDNLWRKEAR